MEDKFPFNIKLKNPLDPESVKLLEEAYINAFDKRHEYVTPEHVLYELTYNDDFQKALSYVDTDSQAIISDLLPQLEKMEAVPENIVYAPSPSVQMMQLLDDADLKAMSCDKKSIEIPHIVSSILNLKNSWAQYILNKAIDGNHAYFLVGLVAQEHFEADDEPEAFPDFPVEDFSELESEEADLSEKKSSQSGWKKLVVCINDVYKDQNPLIGRKDELKKTIRVLCRKDKNNPLHIGEPGVGKTALVYGLAALIEEGKVPQKLQGAKIYRMDLGNLIAGTQFRGDFEKKIKAIMDGAIKEDNVIIYIDEIHNLVGAGAVGESSMDASNFLKPYLETGKIRFIGATTYDEYKRYFAKSKSIIRRFTNIDIDEPSVDETIHILRQLQPRYEDFHQVKYTDEAIEYAVKGSARHLNDRFLPDKAIDLIDESGAEKQLENKETGDNTIDKELVSAVLAKLCKVESLAITDEDPRNLEELDSRISSQLFGQDVAVAEVTEAILMSKAGLSEENKPLASLLFVGPTGVGKTELARLLAKELGVELLRFDMSEYTEKHTVAKLIGSPAGYVGYEDGGLLTDAIRKTPNAVLLLDEIEKAHSDIYNILLQVMDYARLTDNKGNKADFRNVVLIMTSNAGAQFAAQSNVGFASNVTQGDAMMKQVKKTFKPEFLNRLSATVVFNDMSKEMASQILDKKLKELDKKLEAKNVRMEVSQDAKDYLLEKGFTKEYGARELDRVIQHDLKRILMKEILSGSLKNGGDIEIRMINEKPAVCKK